MSRRRGNFVEDLAYDVRDFLIGLVAIVLVLLGIIVVLAILLIRAS